MSSRKTESYEAVFKYIEDNVFKLEPSGLMTDWEAGMRKALRICFPNADLRGCWFHYCQAIRKKFAKLGLHYTLVSSMDARMVKQAIMALPLLPPEKFEEGYDHIKDIAIY